MKGMSKGERQTSAPAVVKLGAARDGAWAALPSPRLTARRRLPGLGARIPATLRAAVSGQQGLPEALWGSPAALWGPPGLERDPHGLQGPGAGPGPGEREVGSARLPGDLRGRGSCPELPKASTAAWPAPPSRPKAPAGVSAAQQEEALQRLLELHSAARRRRRRDREQQRLRVRPRAGIWACLGRGTKGGRTLTAASASPGMPPHCQEPPLPGASPGAPAQRGSTPFTGGCGRAAARPARAGGADASGEDREAAGPRGQEHPELPGVTVAPCRRGSRAYRVVLAFPRPLWSLLCPQKDD
ncbi:uncharacterized protein LOC104652614 [Saimiri boliviensis]|uniref:uncharacterized protein LOC104652614 n=1 Tax=Saimiri boliviensis TaxID=27679 RepID=UPI003D76CF3D